MRAKDYVTRNTLDRKHVYLASIASYVKSDKIRIPILGPSQYKDAVLPV